MENNNPDVMILFKKFWRGQYVDTVSNLDW